jgi:MOSC domain-containing protein
MTSTVSEIWRYPAKSMIGQQLPRVAITPDGVLGDRGWAVRDEVRGGIRGAKKISSLMRLSARYLSEPTGALPPPHIEIDLPDGSTVRSDAPDVNARLSTALDHEVTLWPLQPADNLEHYRRGAPDSDDALAELRNMFGRTEDEPLPDLSGLPLEMLAEFESPPGTYYDVYPLHLLTTASLRSLESLTPGSRADVRRFRPSVLVAAPDDPDNPFPEEAWVGRKVALGEAVLEIVGACPRCVMITHRVDDLPTDRALLRTVIRHAHQNLGVYATVVTPGEMTVGDEVQLLD